MRELKNLIKIMVIASSICLPSPSNAQILDMSVDLSPLQLTDDFLRSLYYCKPYHGEKTSSYKKVNVKTVYDVLGMSEGKCHLKVEGFSNTSVHITQDCLLTTEQAQKYADALSNYQIHKYSPRFDETRINADPNYQKAMDIMSDSEICNFLRDKIDHTSDVRANLTECLPIKNEQEILGTLVVREIVGKNDDGKCHFRFTYSEPKPDTSNIKEEVMDKIKHLKSTDFKYDCLWDDKTTEDYYNVLDAFVIPEEEGFDFQAIDRPNSWEEMDFIIRNCHYEAEK